jgi:Leucine-rich repeat (LRR) protein
MQGFVEVERLVVSTPDNGPTNLEGLEDLERVSRFLDLSSNRSLQNLQGLTNLKSVGNPDTNSGLLIVDSSVSSLDGLESLETLQALEISNSPIDSLAPLEGVEIREGLGITFTEVGSVTGITFDDTELRAVDISNNDKLTSIPALEGVRSVSGGVVFQSNPKLSRCDIDAFVDGLETRPSAEWIRISGNMPCER